MYQLYQDDYDSLGDHVAHAFARTCPAVLAMVAESWIEGHADEVEEAAALYGVNADGLLIASLLVAEHPSICHPTGCPRSIKYWKLLQYAERWDVDNHRKPVDNSCLYVDKLKFSADESVYIPVDGIGTYPHFPQRVPVFW